ncbi:hypothetical protein SEVIR_3G233100v4 [Setaria viridis]|uniref:Uncharacterized protein n=1 Tax=Setaria viridis TaxID=4556 RepID=A0A4U6VEN4_SETVI|nr:hypothetical protein SEVIR_3G233100v2 [Setaria viridis]
MGAETLVLSADLEEGSISTIGRSSAPASDGTSLPPSSLASWLAGCCLSTYLSYYLCARACVCVPALCSDDGGGGGGGRTAAAITILSEQLSFTASSSLVPSLNAASTRSEGIVLICVLICFFTFLWGFKFCILLLVILLLL